ncbi:MAG: tRNA (N6-isopentenyl adenosine(37)-C2)-methylthiotransferase MiaB, partial [Desulfobacterota bacterium]|nr:tRNA (N6-isopentenyl adenosine(37)-C2)-methylthiotransferase MiaB [Thermodesulfobacteriota bacterium]
MAKHYYIETMGCQMNEYDSDHLSRILEDSGYTRASGPEKADFVLLNTCSVRAKAEQKALSRLGRLASLKKKNPKSLLALAGCVAQQRGAELLERFPSLDLVLGPREIGNFTGVLKKIKEGGTRVAATDLRGEPAAFQGGFDYFEQSVKAFITVMEGCNNFCSYCIVPYVRGRETSRAPQELLDEARGLIAQGVKEITLLGQNVNSYAHGGMRFAELLQSMNGLKGLRRIRFTTSHPKDLSPDLIECFAQLDKLCSHIHLPFQAGSNRILKAMKRGYTSEKYMDLIERLRKARPGIAVTSDVMVGFPGETQEDFDLTMDLIRQVEFDNLFSFKYSDREGTPAARMDGKIPESEKLVRLEHLQALQRKIT